MHVGAISYHKGYCSSTIAFIWYVPSNSAEPQDKTQQESYVGGHVGTAALLLDSPSP